MRIPNKFNGYSRDGIRLYNDPATAAAIAAAGTSTGTMAGATLMATGATAGTTAAIASNMALANGMNLGSNLYNAGSGLNSLLNNGVDQAALLPGQISATTPTVSNGIASGFNTDPSGAAQNYLANLQTPAPPAFTPDQMAMNTNIMQSPMLKPTAQITPTVDAVESTYNLSSRFPGSSGSQFPNFQNEQISENLANAAHQQRINNLPPIESVTAPPVAAPAPSPVTSDVIKPADGTISPEASARIESNYRDMLARDMERAALRNAESNSLLNPIISEPGTSPVKLIETPAGGDVVTMGGNTVKPGMTGNAYNDAKTLFNKPNWENIKEFASEHPYWTGAAGLGAYQLLKPKAPEYKKTPSHIRPYTNTRAVSPTANYYTPYSGESTAERNYFTGGLQALPIYEAAEGGLTSLAVGGPIETMSAMNAVGENLGYPQSQYQTDIYSNPNVQRPEAMNMIAPSGDVPVDQYTGEQKFAKGGDTGEYKYSYDPKTQQFTQLNDPVAEAAQQAAQTSQWNSIGQRFQQQAVNPNSWYGAQTAPKVAPKPFTPVVTGGIAQPMQQAAAQAPVQQAAPAQIPAYQTPEQQLGLGGFYDYMNQQLSGMRGYQGFAEGGLSHLGGYSDGGRLLRGPGDGVSDSIPASIGDRQPARLADGEFVVPARIVSEIGNGSTEAGARKLYAMMERVQRARKKSVGKGKVAVNSKADKLLPA